MCSIVQSTLRHGVCRNHSRLHRLATCGKVSARAIQQASGLSDPNGCKPLHLPVMLNEVIDCLSPQEGQTILDMTFGAGGHTTSILKQASNIKILALDRDPKAYEIAQQLSSRNGHMIQPLLGRFSECEDLLISAGVELGTVDGVLLDAGCSSMQFDTSERGFSLSKDGPLDMRMDSDRFPDMPTAADVVNALDQQALASILRTYGEERNARKIASAIVQARSIYPITRTQQLASIVAGTCMYPRMDLLQRPAHAATKTFQALRIFVNDELNELYAGLQTAHKFLRTGGRLVVISFHSLEDRIVKRFLHGIEMTEKPNLSARQRIRREKERNDPEMEEEEDFNSESNTMWTVLQKKVLKPQYQDVVENPRGRSAKLRAAIKL
ncbi:12S rRNA N(4)-cytidine methyltransferase METTL15 [Pelodytes ibericus]